MAKKNREALNPPGVTIHPVLVEKLRQEIGSFTPRQRGLAEFILQNPESLAFLTITDLAKRVGVSEATVAGDRAVLSLKTDGIFATLSTEATLLQLVAQPSVW